MFDCFNFFLQITALSVSNKNQVFSERQMQSHQCDQRDFPSLLQQFRPLEILTQLIKLSVKELLSLDVWLKKVMRFLWLHDHRHLLDKYISHCLFAITNQSGICQPNVWSFFNIFPLCLCHHIQIISLSSQAVNLLRWDAFS